MTITQAGHAPLSVVVENANTFKAAMEKDFRGGIEENMFLKHAATALAAKGFRKHHCLALVGVCRDEICTTFLSGVKKEFGEPFSCRGLGGLVFCGATGFGAAAAHAPDQKDGRMKYVYFFAPHIGVNAEGKLGVCNRPNMKRDSGACGALLAVHGALTSGKVDTEIDHSDLEQSAIRAVLVPLIEQPEQTDLAQLTRIAKNKIVDQLTAGIEATVDVTKADYAVLCGVQVHGPGGINYWVPDGENMFTCVNGVKEALVVKAPTVEEGGEGVPAVATQQCSNGSCTIC